MTTVIDRSAVLELRQRTRDLHERTEATFPLLRPDLDLDTYAATLHALRTVHVPLEWRVTQILQRAAPDGGAELGWRSRRRTSLLRADLASLDVPPSHHPAHHPQLPEVRSLPEALGALYVLEGSRQGAALLAVHVRERLGAGVPCRYLVGVGGATATGWAEVRRVLNHLLVGAGIDAAVAAARATFRAFEGVAG